jgi:OPA family glycerol-3-phosphate transporter-like MFS transporter
MNEASGAHVVDVNPRPHLPPGYRARRGLNWGIVGLMYTSYYLCRYNLSLANKAISDEFGFTKAQMGEIISTQLFCYACGQIINGLLVDKLGGKRAMLTGAVGTIAMNVLFGAASFWGMLWLFVLLRGIDGYVQAFGASGFVKINAAWFSQKERGTFAGIFGFMINLGRFGIFTFGPAFLAGFTFLGMWSVPALHWRWLFWIPAAVATLVAILLAIFVKDTPEEAGFHGVHAHEADHQQLDVHASVKAVFRQIFTNPYIWVIASAYACTGAVRQSIDQWFPRYMLEVKGVSMNSAALKWLGFLIPFVASLGSVISGIVSDRVFGGRRAPVAMGLYFIEACVILAAAQMQSVNMVILFFVLISFTANATHSIMGPAAAMDIGGRKMAGFAHGVIDSFQYFGGTLAGALLGAIVDRSWGYYFYFMVPFGIIGGTLMWTIRNRTSLKIQRRAGYDSSREEANMIVGALAFFVGLVVAVGTYYFATQWQTGFYSVAGIAALYGASRFLTGLVSSVRNEAV